MSEKKTLSKVERFALQSAREKAIAAQAVFQSIIEEVAEAHGIEKEEAERWRFAADFSFAEYVPPKAPAPPVPPVPPAPEDKPDVPTVAATPKND